MFQTINVQKNIIIKNDNKENIFNQYSDFF